MTSTATHRTALAAAALLVVLQPILGQDASPPDPLPEPAKAEATSTAEALTKLQERHEPGEGPSERIDAEELARISAESTSVRLDAIRRCQSVLGEARGADDAGPSDRLALAIATLGRLRAAERPELLIPHIGFKYEPFHLRPIQLRGEPDPAERLPAVRALINIGLPGADACVAAVVRTRSGEDRRKMYWVIGQVLGPQAGRARLEAFAKDAEGGVRTPQGAAVPAAWIASALSEYDDVFPPAGEESAPEPRPGSLSPGRNGHSGGTPGP